MYQQYDTPAQRLVKFGETMRLNAIVSIVITLFSLLTIISALSMILGLSSINLTSLLFFVVILFVAVIVLFIIEIIFLVRLKKAANGTNNQHLYLAFQWYIAAIIIGFVLNQIIKTSIIDYGTLEFSLTGFIKDLVEVIMNFVAVSYLYKWSAETYQIEKDPLLNEVNRGFQFQRIGIILNLIPFIGIIGGILQLIGQFKSANNLITAYQAHAYLKFTPVGQSQPSYSQSNAYNTICSNPPQNPSSPNDATMLPSPNTPSYNSSQMNNPPKYMNINQICPECGATIPKDAKFCYQCGHNIPI